MPTIKVLLQQVLGGSKVIYGRNNSGIQRDLRADLHELGIPPKLHSFVYRLELREEGLVVSVARYLKDLGRAGDYEAGWLLIPKECIYSGAGHLEHLVKQLRRALDVNWDDSISFDEQRKNILARVEELVLEKDSATAQYSLPTKDSPEVPKKLAYRQYNGEEELIKLLENPIQVYSSDYTAIYLIDRSLGFTPSHRGVDISSKPIAISMVLTPPIPEDRNKRKVKALEIRIDNGYPKRFDRPMRFAKGASLTLIWKHEETIYKQIEEKLICGDTQHQPITCPKDTDWLWECDRNKFKVWGFDNQGVIKGISDAIVQINSASPKDTYTRKEIEGGLQITAKHNDYDDTKRTIGAKELKVDPIQLHFLKKIIRRQDFNTEPHDATIQVNGKAFDTQGKLRLSNGDLGNCKVSVSAAGYYTKENPLRFSKDGTQTIKLERMAEKEHLNEKMEKQISSKPTNDTELKEKISSLEKGIKEYKGLVEKRERKMRRWRMISIVAASILLISLAINGSYYIGWLEGKEKTETLDETISDADTTKDAEKNHAELLKALKSYNITKALKLLGDNLDKESKALKIQEMLQQCQKLGILQKDLKDSSPFEQSEEIKTDEYLKYLEKTIIAKKKKIKDKEESSKTTEQSDSTDSKKGGLEESSKTTEQSDSTDSKKGGLEEVLNETTWTKEELNKFDPKLFDALKDYDIQKALRSLPGEDDLAKDSQAIKLRRLLQECLKLKIKETDFQNDNGSVTTEGTEINASAYISELRKVIDRKKPKQSSGEKRPGKGKPNN